jgi:hypothetical protein
MACRGKVSRTRTGHTAHNLSILWRMALHLLCQVATAKRKQAVWNDGYLLRILSNMECDGPEERDTKRNMITL